MKSSKSVSGLASLSSLVYSTEVGRTCPTCRQAKADCRCGRPVLPKGDGIVRVSRETKGRAGKGVTLVKGVPLDEPALIALGKELKAACGSGGTVKDGVIEVQGDHRERVIELLKKKGSWTVKQAGG
ncbi:translation initiation factor Sui1 [Roseateles koreensis]|uniref:Translation initiation factor Sui1 n=1 Tax=Roseateles koreensis TaxID=2987526 RepID=A0ABT5KN27_9BURK|nr:translation initiation factor Sui1 [Roseateles koreensis]MDC8784320.1 translation initiation factor Sui1 [Roseateles koreensis]